MVRLFLFLLPFYVFAKTPVAVIDTGVSFAQKHLLCKNGNISYTSTLYDNHGHGTNVVGIIGSTMNKKKYCIISYKFYENGISGAQAIKNISKALRNAIDRGVKIINLSLEGPQPVSVERKLIKEALDKGIIVVVAAGNDGINLDKKCKSYPACYKFKHKNFIVVGAKDMRLNFGSMIDYCEKGYRQGKPVLSGTSQATANFTKKLVKK
jgi:subtilisin family serine protease